MVARFALCRVDLALRHHKVVADRRQQRLGLVELKQLKYASSGDRLSVLDLTKREIVGEMQADGRSRLSPWDKDGSVLAWSFDRVGGADGQVIPRGLPLAVRVAETASNLRVEGRRLVVKR